MFTRKQPARRDTSRSARHSRLDGDHDGRVDSWYAETRLGGYCWISRPCTMSRRFLSASNRVPGGQISMSTGTGSPGRTFSSRSWQWYGWNSVERSGSSARWERRSHPSATGPNRAACCLVLRAFLGSVPGEIRHALQTCPRTARHARLRAKTVKHSDRAHRSRSRSVFTCVGLVQRLSRLQSNSGRNSTPSRERTSLPRGLQPVRLMSAHSSAARVPALSARNRPAAR